jgi:hypothetical protein
MAHKTALQKAEAKHTAAIKAYMSAFTLCGRLTHRLLTNIPRENYHRDWQEAHRLCNAVKKRLLSPLLKKVTQANRAALACQKKSLKFVDWKLAGPPK